MEYFVVSHIALISMCVHNYQTDKPLSIGVRISIIAPYQYFSIQVTKLPRTLWYIFFCLWYFFLIFYWFHFRKSSLFIFFKYKILKNYETKFLDMTRLFLIEKVIYSSKTNIKGIYHHKLIHWSFQKREMKQNHKNIVIKLKSNPSKYSFLVLSK